MWDLDPVKHEAELMAIFDGTQALDQSTKERIRHKISMRITEQVNTQPWGEYLSDYLSDGCGLVVVVLGGLLVAIVLAIHRSQGQSAEARFGAFGIAVLVSICGLMCLSIGRLKMVEWLGAAWELLIAAVCVFGIQSIPKTRPLFPAWTTVGLRAGLIAVTVIVSGFLLVQIISPFFRYLVNRRHSSRHPEAAIVTTLLQLLAHLERLQSILLERDRLILETLTRQERRDEALRNLTAGETQDVHQKETKIRKLVVSPYLTNAYTFEIQCNDGSWRTAGRESTDVRRRDDGAFDEIYEFKIQPTEGEWIIAMHEERVLPTSDFFSYDPQWRSIRRMMARVVEEVARHIERGLPAKLSVGEQGIDAWVRQELVGRAETVRGWGRRMALPSKSSDAGLYAQVGAILELAAEEQWIAIPTSESPQAQGFRQRFSQFARNVVVGLIPLLVVVIPFLMGIPIPASVRAPILTFAIPWILLQILEFLAPNASDYLSRSKDIREFLSSPIAKLSGGR